MVGLVYRGGINCYTRECIHHDLLVHILYKHLSGLGQRVYFEVPVNIAPIRRSKMVIGEKGRLTVKTVTQYSVKIDLVSLSHNGFTRGYEVIVDFNEVGKTLSQDYLLSRVNSGYFDEFYLAVPYDICRRVQNSYGGELRSLGVGLLCIRSSSQSVTTVISPKRLSRNKILKPGFNEALVKHVAMDYLLNKGYCVYPEIYVPKPLQKIQKISGIRSGPQSYINRLDLIAVRRDCTPCKASYDLCGEDIIGVEVKYDISKPSRSITQRLRDYLNSGVISKIYLVVDNRSNIEGLLRRTRGLADLIVVDPSNRTAQYISNNAETVKPRYCAFAFENPSRTKLHIYTYCNLCNYKSDVSLPSQLSNTQALGNYIAEIVSRKCNINADLPRPSDNKIIYVRRTRSTHILYTI